MSHMRRVKVQEQNDKKIDEYSRRNECYGDDGGNTSAELIQLRRMCQDKDKHIRNQRMKFVVSRRGWSTTRRVDLESRLRVTRSQSNNPTT